MRNTRKIHAFQRSLAALLALSLTLGPASAYALRIEQKTEQPRAGLEELQQSLAGLEEEPERGELRNSLRAWPPRIFPVTVVQNARYPYQIRVRYGSLEGAVPVRFVLQNSGEIQDLNVLSGWAWKHKGERFHALPMHVPSGAPVVFALINSWNVPQPETSQQWLKSPALFRLGVSRADPSSVEDLLSRFLQEGADPRFRLLQWSRSREEWESLLDPRARWAIVHWMAEHRTPEPVGFGLLSFFENVASHRSSPLAEEEDSARGLAVRVAGEITAGKTPSSAGLEETAQQKLETVRAHLHNLLGMHSSAQGALGELLSALPLDEPGRSTLEGVRASLNQLDRDLGQRQASYRRVAEGESTADGAALPVRLQMKIGMIEAIGNAYGDLPEIPEKDPGEKPKAASYRRVLRSSIDSIRKVVRETEEEIEGIRPAAEVIDLAVMLESHRDQWRLFSDFLMDGERFSLDLPTAPLEARLDAVALIEVMENLLQNARNAMRAAGILPTGRIAVRLFSEDGTHRISVRNDGPPLPERFLERINAGQVPAVVVEDETGAEHGLGLAFVARKAKEWGGRLEARNLPRPEQGVEFTLILPAVELAAVPLAAGLEERVKLFYVASPKLAEVEGFSNLLMRQPRLAVISGWVVTPENPAQALAGIGDPDGQSEQLPQVGFLLGMERSPPELRKAIVDKLRAMGVPIVHLREIPSADALGEILGRLDRGARLRLEDSFLLRSPQPSAGDFNWEEAFGFPMQQGVAELEILEEMGGWPLEQARGVLDKLLKVLQIAVARLEVDAVGFLLLVPGLSEEKGLFWVSKEQTNFPMEEVVARVGRSMVFTEGNGRLPDFLEARLVRYRAAPGDAPRQMLVLVPKWSDEEPDSPAGLEEGRRALGEWADSIRADVIEGAQRQEKIAFLFEPGMVQRPRVGTRGAFQKMERRFVRMGFPLKIDSWSEERAVAYREQGFQVIRILPESAEAPITLDRVYVRLEDPSQQIPLRFVPVVVTEALALFTRARGGPLTQRLLFDLTPFLNLQGVRGQDIWQVLADRFA